jgi:hypothetical protein
VGTYGEMAALIGRQGTLRVQREGFTVRVRILDVRVSYGRRDFLVEPVDGSGRAWVQAKRVRLSRASK